MGSVLRIVNYAVNGSGTGHLTRLLAVSRWLRRYASVMGVRAEIYFLTSSEADGMLFAERFASFKIPSKTSVAEAGIDRAAYLALAKQWVWHSLGLLRPDLLVVDTFPRGSFGELLGALDLCRYKAFVHRPVKDEFAARPDFRAMLPLYDLILVPEYEQVAPGLQDAGLRRRTVYTGPILHSERAEHLPRDAARAQLGVPPGTPRVLYLSGGGGGDPGAEAQLHQAAAALRELADTHLVVGAGPLYRGRPLRGAGVTFVQSAGMAELMGAFDAAVCAAGYNTFYELMYAGVPTVFLPQEKVADAQDARAERAVAAGAARILRTLGAAALRAEVELLLASPTAAAAARGLVPQSHARDAAAALWRLLLPAAQVEEAQAAFTDGLLHAATTAGASLAECAEVLDALRGPRRPAPTQRGAADDDDDDADEEGEALPPGDVAARLLRWLQAQEVPLAPALRLVRLLGGRMHRGGVAERGAAVERVLQALAPFGDWAGALALLRQLGQERRLLPGELAEELAGLLAGLLAQGQDLYRGVALLAEAQGAVDSDGEGERHNEALLRAARARLRP